jgi:hypothetical protein
MELTEIYLSEMLESSEKPGKEENCLVGDSEANSKSVGDRKELPADHRQRFEVTVVADEIEYQFPTFWWQIYHWFIRHRFQFRELEMKGRGKGSFGRVWGGAF